MLLVGYRYGPSNLGPAAFAFGSDLWMKRPPVRLAFWVVGG